MATYLPTFDVTSEEAQVTLEAFCQRLKSFDLTYSDDLQEKVKVGTGKKDSIKCFMSDLKEWLVADKQAFPIP